MQRDNAYLKTKAYRVILFLFLSIFTLSAFAQKGDSTLFFRSSLSVTHNGFSFIPSFSLGKPAAILDVAVGNKRLSFEPQFRFALEGKPWSFIFIYRYKFIDRDKFQFTFGGHIPAIVFRTETVTTKYRNKRCSYLIAIFSYGAYTQLLALKKCKHWLKLSARSWISKRCDTKYILHWIKKSFFKYQTT